jgi:large subunit ribosomal protein L3
LRKTKEEKMIPGILGKKIGMTRIFTEEGVCIPVTVLEAGPCTVQVVKVTEKDGYNAVQLGFCDAKEKRVKKPQRAFLKALGLKPKKFVREIRCEEVSDIKVGDEVTNLIFQKGDMVDVTGTSKGKGFQGGVRRHGWAGGSDTHGSMSHRAPGSIGQSSYPSRVFKGLRMAGHMGAERVTTQNLEVIEVDKEKDTLLIRGAVPGANGSYVVVRYARKKVLAPREEVSETENTEEKA